MKTTTPKNPEEFYPDAIAAIARSEMDRGSVMATTMKDLLTYAEASAFLRDRGMPISAGTLRNWKSNRRISVYKIGGKVRVSRNELNRLIEKSQIKAVV